MGLLGCHVSGAVDHSPKGGYELGCEIIQIFTRNPSQWKSKSLTDERTTRFREQVKTYGFKRVMVHGIYIINLASYDKALRKRSETAFLEEMDRCEALQIPYLIFHPGSHRETTETKGLRNLVQSLQRLLNKRPSQKVKLLIENTAGGGSLLGGRFEQIAEIRNQLKPSNRVKVCFDTAHAYAAGYDLQTPEGLGEVLDQFDATVGLKHLLAFHLNDTPFDLGSQRDRHANLGFGQISTNTFASLINDPRFRNHPMALETPGGEEWFVKNLKILFQLRT
jgi:deoxyribonuclease-4